MEVVPVKRASLAVAVLILAAARADEASLRAALDDARAQLQKKQWDKCRDALATASKEMKGLDPRTRANGQKEHDQILAGCNKGEKDYPHKKLVKEIKTALQNASQEVEWKNYDNAASFLEQAKKQCAPLDPETQDRFGQEIAAVSKVVEAGRLDGRLEQIDRFLDKEETELARKTPSLSALKVSFAFVEAELAQVPESDPRRAPRLERLAAHKKAAGGIGTSERDVTVGAALSDWANVKDRRDLSQWPREKAPALDAWRKEPRLLAHAGACERTIDAVEEWLASVRLKDAQAKFGSDPELVAAVEEARKTLDGARLHLCEIALAIMDSCDKAESERTRLAAGVRELVRDLERRVKGSPKGNDAIARARALAAALETGSTADLERAGLAARLRTTADEVWPAFASAHGAAALGSDAIPADDSWKGKVVLLQGIGNRVSDPFTVRHSVHLVATVNGALLAGQLDEGLFDAIWQTRLQIGVDPEAMQEAVGEVVGHCRIDPEKAELALGDRPGIEVPYLKIVAVKAGPYAFSVAAGSNMTGIPGVVPVAVNARGIPSFERRLAGHAKRPLWLAYLPLGLLAIAGLTIVGGSILVLRSLRERNAAMTLKRTASGRLPAVSAPAAPAGKFHPLRIENVRGLEVRKTYCPVCEQDVAVNDNGRCVLCGSEVAEPTGEVKARQSRRFTPRYNDSVQGSLVLRLILVATGMFLGLAGLATHSFRYNASHGWTYHPRRYVYTPPPPRYPQPSWNGNNGYNSYNTYGNDGYEPGGGGGDDDDEGD